MMVRRGWLVALAAMVLGLSLAGAGATNMMQAKPTAVAVVDLDALFNKLEEKQEIDARATEMGERIKAEEQSYRKKIEDLRFKLDALDPNSAEHKQTQNQIEQAVINLEVWARFEQRKLNRERGLQMESLYRDMTEAIGKVAQTNGYDLVLYKESQPPQFNYESPQQLSALISVRKVLWSKEEVEITSQVAQHMNNAFNAGR